ncbi:MULTISPECIES: DUF4760 domain-containing protein [Serratia]|uniref:DUF4760 domain-containing protein n=1 Tax=Serratia TaxID=613 RepID=UPI001C1E81EC|nr:MULTISPECIES: DUF4760 domain-containing protein [Serratia]MCA3994668.1 DUF4760 domain-containing protein [Serratia marcescens]MDM1836194.1 DUF4760 domain-containing protein [Serratia marcescens]MDM1848938.1 DUF4760 domain-containing protein [Serratia marcescens]QWU34422.1 DUF4760 domain-containing protein [Serratia ureilytica]UMK49548.1 DUF4760 domain-containing protein [Serratia marcescens]
MNHDFWHAILAILKGLWKNNPTFYSTIIAALVAAAIAIISIRKQRQTSREKNSLDFESSYKRSDKVEEAWQTLLDILKVRKTIPLEMWGRDEVRQTKEARALMTVFNEWERCANAIRNGLYDDLFLYKVFGSTVIFLAKEFEPYLAARRSINIKFYGNFCWLAETWMIRRGWEQGEGNLKLPFNVPFTPSLAIPPKKVVRSEKRVVNIKRPSP